MAVSLLGLLMAEGVRELFEVALIRTTVLVLRVNPLLLPKHIPKTPPPNTIPVWGRFQHRFGGDTSIQSLEGKGHASHGDEKEMPPCLVPCRLRELRLSQWVAWDGRWGPTLGTQTGASLLVLQAFPGSLWRPPHLHHCSLHWRLAAALH